jgi:uncharacterized protein YndB with AHSA1/START domain
MTSPTNQPPTIEVTVAAPVATVWESLRNPDLIRRWHGWHYGEDLDKEIQLIFGNPESVDEANHVLVAGGSDRFELTEVPGGTRVRITRPPYVPDEEWSAYYDDITEGWTSFLQQLKFMHEVHPGEERRTIFLMARGPADGVPTLLKSPPVELGETWFQSAHQQGAVLPTLGPGLVITAAKDPVAGEEGPMGADAMVIITTYGLDDAAFDEQREAWTTWWRSVYPDAEPAAV